MSGKDKQGYTYPELMEKYFPNDEVHGENPGLPENFEPTTDTDCEKLVRLYRGALRQIVRELQSPTPNNDLAPVHALEIAQQALQGVRVEFQ